MTRRQAADEDGHLPCSLQGMQAMLGQPHRVELGEAVAQTPGTEELKSRPRAMLQKYRQGRVTGVAGRADADAALVEREADAHAHLAQQIG